MPLGASAFYLRSCALMRQTESALLARATLEESRSPDAVAAEEGDAELVQQFLAGNEASFRSIYARHHVSLARLLYSMGASRSELEDIIQETFVVAYKGLVRLREPERLRTWLSTIAVRELRRTRRRAGFRARMNQLWAEFGAKHADPRRRAPLDDLQQVLEELPLDLRIPWVLQRIGGHSLAEVAEVSGISVATVKRRLAEADARVERRLARDA